MRNRRALGAVLAIAALAALAACNTVAGIGTDITNSATAVQQTFQLP